MAPAPCLTFLPITLIRDIPCAIHNHSELCAMKPQPHIIWIDTTVVLLPPTITNLLATINGIYAAAIDDM
ncbi:hypothetical protein HYDPIDRAFT_30334 [Hydnomerulius pinastri MD-312]|uniref:Uncharacterized protein n=1 Tax=Hydnomerulius pinastri MD-312 TaxID=994086 RepID=A0A0C9VAS5_9AGAM|nr:hypothetical protein HYDPIDRAFT_30334 [Hydnomerulius pinastri MD-312]